MKISATLTAIACLFVLTSLANADQTIASPTVFGAHTQEFAHCIIGNFGTDPVSVDVHIFNESGNVVPASSSCLAPVGAKFVCSVFAPINFGAAYGCSATTSGSAKKLRGTLVLYDRVSDGFGSTDDIPLRSAELR